MPNIELMTNSEWLVYRSKKVDEFYAKGFELKPNSECSTCDVHDDYVCFEHELSQMKEVKNAKSYR